MARFLPLDATDGGLFGDFDPDSIRRGADYAQDGRVTGLAWSHDGLLLRGQYAGSRRHTYLVEVDFGDAGYGERAFMGATCTCPVGWNCKHAAALLLSASRQQAPTSGLVAPVDVPTWRSLLGQLAADDAGREKKTGNRPIGILVESDSAARGELGALTLRLVSPGKTGKLVRTGITWGSVQPGHRRDYYRSTPDYPLSDLIPSHLAAVRAIYNASSERYLYGSDQVIVLGAAEDEIWGTLTAAEQVGVRFIAHKSTGAERVVIADGRASLRVIRDDEGLRVLPWLEIDGHEWDRSPIELFGAGRPHGFAVRMQHAVIMGRFEAPASIDAFSRLFSIGGGVAIPDADADEFSAVLLPDLTAAMFVDVADDALTTPDVVGPLLVLNVVMRLDGGSTTQWAVAYDVNGRRRVFDVDTGGGFRDDVAESAAWRKIRPEMERGVLVCGRWRQQAVAHAHRAAGTSWTGLSIDATDQQAIQSADTALLTASYSYSPVDTARFAVEVIPELREHGVEVEIAGEQPDYRAADNAPRIEIAAGEGSGTDWFDLSITLDVDGTAVPIADVLRELAHGATHVLLADGTYFPLDSPDIVRLAELVEEAKALGELENGRVRTNSYNATLWEELLELGVVDKQLARWRQRLQRLAAATPPVPCPAPAGLHADLREYQAEGLDWLHFLWQNRIGGILADDMGLGKTIQALAMIATAIEDKPDGRFLVVAPTSVISNWVAEAHRFVPDLDVLAVTATSARVGVPLSEQVQGRQIIVTSYMLMRLEYESLAELEWTGVILDEAQFVKNHNSKAHQCARRLDAEVKLAITGTPMENNLMELWSLLSLTAPGLFPSPKVFTEYFRKPIESGEEPDRLALLRRRIRPVMLRRTKDQVATDLPPKQEQVLSIDLNAKHDKIYKTRLNRERQKVLGLLGDYDENRFVIFRSLTMLRQLSLHAGLVDDKHGDVASAKIDYLAEQLPTLVAEGHSALVFSQFTGFLGLVADRLTELGLDHGYLDGTLSAKKRASEIKRFTTGETKVFLISLKAGGFGLNLTEADYCFVCDPWWNPAAEAQAVDRSHRIGQTRPVTVYRLVSAGTIEEKVVELQNRKRDLFSAVVDDGDLFGSAISAADIQELIGGT